MCGKALGHIAVKCADDYYTFYMHRDDCATSLREGTSI
jgi:hypothetical protein